MWTTGEGVAGCPGRPGRQAKPESAWLLQRSLRTPLPSSQTRGLAALGALPPRGPERRAWSSLPGEPCSALQGGGAGNQRRRRFTLGRPPGSSKWPNLLSHVAELGGRLEGHWP